MQGRGKVVWTDIERGLIARHAADLQERDPNLVGLPLLREAVKRLPADRRRDLVAVSQAPWFSRVLREERKRRGAEASELVPMHVVWKGMHVDWMEQTLEGLSRIEAILERLEGVMRGLGPGPPGGGP